MVRLGVQTKGIVNDSNPAEGFELLKQAGFDCADFSLNSYLQNRMIYQNERNDFFDKDIAELKAFFAPHKQGARRAGICINQLHMPYPIYVYGGEKSLNSYLRNEVAVKSMQICEFLECSNIVVHGFKLAHVLGSEEMEWERTEKFLDALALMAKEMGITICVENLYHSIGKHLVEGPCCDATKAIERIDRFNDKYGAEILGFCFDTGHANLVGLDFEKFIGTLGNRLKVLHVHDNDGVRDMHQIPFTFTRNRENLSATDWDGFLKGLRKIRYEGVISFETAPVLSAFPRELQKETLEFIAQIGKYFASQI